MCYKIYSLKIAKVRLIIFLGFAIICPYLILKVGSPIELFCIQSFFIFFRPDSSAGLPIFFKYFPIFKRFTSVTLSFAISRAFMHVVTSFGFYIVEYFNNWGLLIIMLPTGLAFLFGITHFETLEKTNENYFEKDHLPELEIA